MCYVVDGQDLLPTYTGLRLQYKRNPRIETPILHFEAAVRCDVGMMDHRTHHGVISAIIEASRPHTISKVGIRKLQAEMVHGDKFLIRAADDLVLCVIVKDETIEYYKGDRMAGGVDEPAAADDEADGGWAKVARNLAAKPKARGKGKSRPTPAAKPASDATGDNSDPPSLMDVMAEMIRDLDAKLDEDGECLEAGDDSSASSVGDVAEEPVPSSSSIGVSHAVAAPPASPTPAPPSGLPGPSASSTASPDDLVRAGLANCIELYKDIHDADLINDACGIEHKLDGTIWRKSDDKKIGLVKVTFQGKTLFAKCDPSSGHGSACTLLVNINGEYGKALAWLTKWLIQGSVCSACEHTAAKGSIRAQVKAARSVEKPAAH